MTRSKATVVVLLAVAALGTLFVATDPLQILGGGRSAAEEGAGDELVGTGDGPRLEGVGAAGRPLPREVNGEPVGVLTLKLGTGELRGTVTGGASPLVLARVEVVLPPPWPSPAVRTGAGGAWAVKGLPSGTYDLRATMDGFFGRSVTAPPLADGQEVEVPAIDLVRRGARADGLEVKVTDLLGRPVAGAQVLATTLTWSVDIMLGRDEAGARDVIRRTAATDEKGVALMEGLPAEEYDVVATAPTFTTVAVEGVQVGRGRVLPMTIRLGPGVSISGKVVDAEGKPIAGAYAFGLHQPSWSPCVGQLTRKDGTFTLDGLREGTYMLFAGDEEHGTAELNRIASPSEGHVITLRGAGAIAGRVTTADGKPVPAFQLRPVASRPFGYEYSHVVNVSDADGKYRTMLPPGPYELRVSTEDGGYAVAEKILVEPGQDARADVVLGTTGIVRGVVTDPSGTHLEGAEVFVNMGGMPGGPSREHYARTDADGRFEVRRLGLEKVTLHARHAAWADARWEGAATPAASAPSVTIKMGAGARIEGRVALGDGRGSAGEQINLWQTWFESRTIFTDADGRFVFERVAPGKWNLSTGAFENGSTGLTKNGIVVGSEGVVTVELAHAAGQGTLVGQVLVGGQPAVGATVNASDARGAGSTTTTDEQGRFECVGLAAGRVQVYVETKDGQIIQRSARIPSDGLKAEITISVGRGALVGRVVNAEGLPITNAWVTAERLEEGRSDAVASRSVGTDGTFEMKGLDAGSYHLRLWAGGYAQTTTEAFALGEGESKDLGSVRMQRGGDVSGRVTDDEGRPVENATISLKDSGGRPVFSFSLFTTGSDGRYSVQGVVPGRYVVGAEAQGLAPAEQPVDVGEAGGTADLVVRRGGTLVARVVDADGKPLEGARVTLTDSRGQRVTRTLSLLNFFDSGQDRTNAEGQATLPDLAAGGYRVGATLSGHVLQGDEAGASVTPGGSSRVTITLVPAAPR
jgi:protocatechuate 3,4-dioxygenase beta subunit